MRKIQKKKTRFEFNTLTRKYSLLDMYLFVGIIYFINSSAFVPLLTGLIGFTIGSIIIDIFIYLLKFYENYKINKILNGN